MTYRSEIDGLRSIAVMAVVLFHFGVPGISGGFVGVDIFFVISGFLIGSILWGELASTGRISFSRFYARRIKRLMPAYSVVALVTFAFAWLIFLPFEMREFGKALIASTVYLSNILFYRQSGYFDSGAEEKVFLHMWSLSVEEQFYIVLPILLLVLSRNKTLLIIALCAIFLASLISSIFITFSSQNAAFYLFQYRAWELLAGVLLAIYGREKSFNWQVSPWLSWLGITLVFGGIFFIDPAKGFPGYQVIFPVLGTVLLILNGRDTNAINRMLSLKTPVAIGLISYSLYLWHWPVFVLSHYYYDGYGTAVEPAFWIALSMLLAWLSWRFVERPFRRANAMSSTTVFMSAAGASILLVALGAMLFLKDGLPNRFGPTAAIHINASADFLQDWSRCYVPETGDFAGVEVCPIGPENQAPKVVIWGDSHLRAFKEGIAQQAREQNVAALLIWHAGCPPLFEVTKQETAASPQQDKECMLANQQIRATLPNLGIERILLVGRWAYYAQGSGIGLDAENEIRLSMPFSQAVSVTISELEKSFSDIFILRQVPEVPEYDSRNISRLLAHGRIEQGEALGAMLTVAPAALEARIKAAEAAFEGHNITLLDPWPLLCDENLCAAVHNGEGYYFDNNHLTNTGARRLREIFMPVFTLPEGESDG